MHVALDLRARLLQAVAAKDLRAVATLFKDHRSTIRAAFADWSTVPLDMRRDEAGLARYGEMLITLARLFEKEGDEGPISALRGDPAVATLHTTNGRWDMVAELRADSLEAFDRVLGRIRQIEGIAHTETSLLLSTHKL